MENHEIDKLIAEKVMGWEVQCFPNLGTCEAITDDEILMIGEDFAPSTQIEDAWRVVDAWFSSYGTFELNSYENTVKCWVCQFGNHGYVTADSAPLAISLAALKAVGVEVHNGQTL